MKITIITVCKNAAANIGDCIRSVQSQSHDNVEHWIIDGASTDQTLAEIKTAGHPANRLISEADSGQYEAMNKGLKLATGELVGFLHADDLYASTEVLQSVVRTMQDQTLSACYSDLTYVSPHNIAHIIRYWKSESYRPGLFLKGWMLPHPTFFARRKIYQKLGNFDTQLTIGADWDLLLRFIEVQQIATRYVPELWIKMRTGGASNRSLANILHNNCQCLKAFRKYQLKPSPIYPFYKLYHRLAQFIGKSSH